MDTQLYNQRYYKKHRKQMIQDERRRRKQRRVIRINNGERFRQTYKTKKKTKYGHSICRHGIEWSRCRKCKGGSICEHDRRRSICLICSPLGYAKRVLKGLKRFADEDGYKAPKISPEDFIKLRIRTRHCVLCEQRLTDELPALHHNHRTGKVIGFTHRRCNSAEGFIEKLNSSARAAFIKNIQRPL